MYRELAPPQTLAPSVACLWVDDASEARSVPVVPDACVDLIWNGSRLFVAGPDTRPVLEACSAAARFTAVRLRTGCAGAVLGVPASAVRDARVDLADLWGERARRLVDALAFANTSAQHALLLQAVAARRAARPDRVVLALVERLERAERVSTAALAAELGISARQLQRRCVAAIGYGPKLLARVLRLHAFRRAVRARSRRSLAELAAELGYVDQAHLGHDARELFGVTPATLRRRALRTSGREHGASEIHKTGVAAPGTVWP